MRRAVIALALALTGCGQLLGIGDLTGPAGGVDAGPDAAGDGGATVPSQIQIGGKLRSPVGDPISGVVELRTPDGISLGQTTSDSAGKFLFVVPTQGKPLDVAIVVPSPDQVQYPDMFVYFGPYVVDLTDLVVNVLTRSDVVQFQNLAGEPIVSGTALVVCEIHDAADQPVAGATIHADAARAAIHYTTGSNLPSPTPGSATASDGRVFLFNARPSETTLTTTGSVTVTPRRFSVIASAVYEIALRP